MQSHDCLFTFAYFYFEKKKSNESFIMNKFRGALLGVLCGDCCGAVFEGDQFNQGLKLVLKNFLKSSEKELVKLGVKLHDLTQDSQNLSVAIKIGLADHHEYLANNLEDLSDVDLTVEKLKSGDFWDVDGKLIIRKRSQQEGVSVKESERSLLFFIGDHAVKLSAPGEFGLKV